VWHEVKEHRLGYDEDALGDENVEQSPVVNYALIRDKEIKMPPAFDETMVLCYSSRMITAEKIIRVGEVIRKLVRKVKL
jgi:hypothetical protein